MLSFVNKLNHGYIAIPVITACEENGLFDLFKEQSASLEEAADKLKANKGNLQVALKLLESMGWLEKNKLDEYQLNDKALSYYTQVPKNIIELLEFPIDLYLKDSRSEYSLRTWIELSQRRWNIDDETISDFLDGVLLIPLLQGLQRCELYDNVNQGILFNQLSSTANTEIVSLFLNKHWCEEGRGKLSLTEIGKFIMKRSMNTGTVASYTPMLIKMGELIFGDSASVFEVNQGGHEGHVDRTLNVVSSGFQHDRYFREVEEVILSIFNQKPFEDQPRYVADIGCGDGTLLKRVYNTVLEQSERGKVIAKYPLTMIGVDYNEKALDATLKNLHGIDHFVLMGDIGDPAKMELDLQDHVTNLEEILYIRSFLDHDRPFIHPVNKLKIEYRKQLTYDSVCVDRDGALIDPAIAVQSLVEHLERWSTVRSKYGIIILEVHCLSAAMTSQYLNESENLHFDAYHAFSRQCLNEASVFVMSAAESGLIPNFAYSKKYPKTFPFARITINYFTKKAYKIRHALPQDISTLVTIETVVVPEALRSTEGEIRERIVSFPQGQNVLIHNEEIIGVIYSQRTSRCEPDKQSIEKAIWTHIADSSCFELLYVVVPDKEHKEYGIDLIDFMRQYAFLECGVEEVVGDLRCKSYLENSDQTQLKEKEFSPYLDNYVNNYKIKPEEDTVHAELALEAFGARWLLHIIQQMGVLKKAGERYASSTAIATYLKILPKYHRLFDSLLGVLERNRLISMDDSGLVTTGAIEHFALVDVEKQVANFRKEFEDRYPTFTAFLKLMVRCLENYGEVLVGKIEANDVVFPSGSMGLFAGIFKNNKVADYFNDLVAEIVFKRLQDIRFSRPHEHISILEIGAGTGGATDFVVERIQGIAQNITLYYTDISSSFTRYGQSRLGQKYPWIQFERFNVEEDPIPQGFENNSFDIVYASNVLHDTKYLNNTFAQVQKLLKKHGLLILNEFTVMKDLLLYTGGLLHGWWLFEDPDNRLKNSCLLSIDKWQKMLESNGFEKIKAFGLPFEKSRECSRQAVIFCALADLSREDQNFGKLNSNHINAPLNLVKECMRLIIGEKRMVKYTPDMPLMELGFDSLELLELRELLGKKVGRKLSAPFLFEHNTAAKIAVYFQESTAAIKGENEAEANKEQPQAASTQTLQLVKDCILAIVDEKRMEKYSSNMPLMEFGLDSLELLELRELLSKKIGRKLSAPFLFKYNTAAKIAVYFQESTAAINGENEAEANKEQPQAASTKTLQLVKDSMLTIIGEKRMTKFSPEVPLMELGLDSLELLELRELLAKKLNTTFRAPFLFQHNTATKIAQYIEKAALLIRASENSVQQKHIFQREFGNCKDSNSQIFAESPRQFRKGDIAVVGISLRFPQGIGDTEKFWDLLSNGRSAVGLMSKERWNWPSDIDIENEKSYLLSGGFLEKVDEFDASFFRISRKEAELMDPQQRMLLELSWELMEDAGYKPSALSGTDTGVYIGACHFEYRKLLEENGFARDAYFSTGTSGSLLANRLSYFFDLQGPSVVLDTACSSSLVTIHEAVKGIREGICKQAIVGGANIICSSVNVLSYDEAGMLSRDGKCYTFDDRANGYVRGEGVGMVFIKRVEDALKDNDQIYAVIKGSAVNHGGQASSLTAPNPNLQAQLIIKAIDDASVPVESIGYIEAHGTGTSLGDPIETEGLKQAFLKKQEPGKKKAYCGLGSVKSNLGHLEGAAGVAGLIKVILSLQHNTIPATLNYRRLNPEVDLSPTFYIADKTCKWQPGKDARGNIMPRRGGVSAFGFGGANAHVILEEFVDNNIPDQEFVSPYIFLLSAKSESQLLAYAKKFAAFLSQNKTENIPVANICYTLQVAREELKERLAIVFSEKEQLLEKLEKFVTDHQSVIGVYQSPVKPSEAETSAFKGVGDENQSLETMLYNEELEKLAALWVKGISINWARLYGRLIPKRISLPKLPFMKERYWLPERGVDSGCIFRGLNRDTTIHPLAQKNASDFSGQKFSSVFTGREFFLRDHVVNGQKVLPGVAYLEMAREAVSKSVAMQKENSERVSLKNIVWLQPIVVGENPITVHINLVPESEGEIAYQIYIKPDSKGVKPVIHSQGSAELQVVSQKHWRDPTLLKHQCDIKTIDFEQCYQAFDAMGVEYGAGHKAIEEIYVGKGKVLAKLSIPSSIADTMKQYVLHPSLLDAALQASFAFTMESAELKPLLPFAMDRLDVLDQCVPEMWAIVTQVEGGVGAQKFDIELCDTKGNICVVMKGYAPRALESRLPISQGLNTLSNNKPTDPSAEILMLTPVWDNVVVDVKETLPRAHHRVVIIGGSKNEQGAILHKYPQARVLEIDPNDNVEAIARKIEPLDNIEHIVWISPHDTLDSLADESLITDQQKGVIFGFRIIKALLRLEYDVRDLNWTVITVQAQPVYKNETVNPTHISIHGLIGSMAKEYLNWKVRLVDLEKNMEWPMDEIFSLPPDQDGKTWVYRTQQWYRQQLIPTQMPAVDNKLYRVGGVYVVIGGAGGIGEAWSDAMIRNYRAQIVWIGRRPEDTSIRERLDKLALLGPKPMYLSADATDRHALEKAYQQIKRHFTHIHGIIHSALVLMDQSLVNMDEERFRAGLAAKVDVSVRLAQVFGNESLDFVMFYSSITAFAKIAGQSNYASGCVFKDVYAHQLARQWPCAVKVMNWGYWGSVGIAASKEYQVRMAKSGIGSIEPQEAMEGLDKLLIGEIDQVALIKSIKAA